MESAQKELLMSAGVDLTGALERFMNNEKMYELYLKRFVESTNYTDLETALSQKDWREALSISHNLKGVTGSLGFTRLYDLMSSQVAMLRQDDNESAAGLMDEIMAERQRLLKTARKIVE